MDRSTYFPHDRLDVHRAALQLAVVCDQLAKSLPPGYHKIADNLRRSSQGLPLLIGEGANRRTPAQKRQRYGEARGEAGECASALQLALELGVVEPDVASNALVLAGRVCAMLTRLIQSTR